MHSSRIKKKVKDDYDEIASSFSKTRNSAWAEFEFFSPFYKSSSKVLDLGCGNGRLYDYLKKFGFKSYLGVDQSKNLINEARKHHSKAKFQVVDMAKLNGLKGEYDALFAIASFHHLAPSEQLQTLKKWRSHMKPGGILYMTNWNLHQPKYFPLLLRSLIMPSFGFRGVLVPWQNKLKRYYFAFTKRRLRRLLKKAGYKILFHEYVKHKDHANLFTGRNILTIAENE